MTEIGSATKSDNTRLIDRWFPVAAVDAACGTTAGSGLTEKALFTWFASRPIAQARAAALTVLLPDNSDLKPDIERAVRFGDRDAMNRLARQVVEANGGQAPVVLDCFSGRGIISLETSRAGAISSGFDLSPVATLAGRLLADYPSRDWSAEPILPQPFATAVSALSSPDRLVGDVELVLAEVDRRVADRVLQFYPRNARGEFPWGYLWATTLPCDHCKAVFPLVGDLRLRLGSDKSGDSSQSLRIETVGANFSFVVVDGPPTQSATYIAGTRADGKKKKGKSARCPFCAHVHDLDAVKAKCRDQQQRDLLVAVGEADATGKRVFRSPTQSEYDGVARAEEPATYDWPYETLPNEHIPPGNVHTVMGSGYGCATFGDLMVKRQARQFIETVQAIRDVHNWLLRDVGVSADYARALTSYAASNLCRRLRRSTRGASLALLRGGVSDIFTNETKINFGFDSFETGPGEGAGTWASVSKSSVRALRKLVTESRGLPARLLCASATSLPRRDASIDAIVTDPPYYDMVEYADASDIFYVWLKRILFDVEPDLFGVAVQQSDGLQEKNLEIIVRRVHEPNRVRHDTAFYEAMLAKAFSEARRVLKPNGHLVVMFGHSDPDAWRRLLGALGTAGFVVTSAWPSRTESGDATVASIKVTITIGCRVATPSRPLGIGSEVDREVVEAIAERVQQWDEDGLALEDQLMASYGPAMEVYGRYSRVINPDGGNAELDHYLALARRAVRDAMRLRVDELPLETFDAITRFAIFWLRAKGRAEVPKGEALFFAQADELHLDSLRERILLESKGGFQIRLDDDRPVTQNSSVFEVVRAMANAWADGGMESVASTIATAGLEPNNQHLWAVVGDLANNLPASDKMAKALAGIKRSSPTISTLVASANIAAKQRGLFDMVES